MFGARIATHDGPNDLASMSAIWLDIGNPLQRATDRDRSSLARKRTRISDCPVRFESVPGLVLARGGLKPSTDAVFIVQVLATELFLHGAFLGQNLEEMDEQREEDRPEKSQWHSQVDGPHG